MKKLANAVQGDTYSPQTITWDGQNLTGATITAVKQHPFTGDVTAVTGTLAVTNAASGIFTWTYSEADTGTPGSFVVQFRASYGAQADATMRASWYVEPLLAATAVAAPPLVGIGPDEAAWLDAATPGGALGTAAYAATGDFDAAGSAAAIAGDLTTHEGLGDTAHNGILPKAALQRSVAGNHTLEAGDAGYIVRITAAGTVTLPNGLATNLQAVIRRSTADVVALAATTLNAIDGGTKIPDQHGAVLVVHQGSGVWDVYGVLEV